MRLNLIALTLPVALMLAVTSAHAKGQSKNAGAGKVEFNVFDAKKGTPKGPSGQASGQSSGQGAHASGGGGHK
jgi:hypothetical protein